MRQLDITAERTMLEIARCALSDAGALFDDAGNLKSVKDLPDDIRRAVASVKTLKTNIVSGDQQQETTREVKLWDKVSSLRTLAQHFGLVTEKVEHSVSEPLLAALDVIKARNRKKGEE